MSESQCLCRTVPQSTCEYPVLLPCSHQLHRQHPGSSTALQPLAHSTDLYLQNPSFLIKEKVLFPNNMLCSETILQNCSFLTIKNECPTVDKYSPILPLSVYIKISVTTEV